MSTISSQLRGVEKAREVLEARHAILLEKALKSSSPSDLLKAKETLDNIPYRQQQERKSYLLDPQEMNSYMGFKNKPYSLSYNMLRRISYSVPILRAVIMTRIDQVAAFCEPQSDKYSTGFVIRKKRKYGDKLGNDTPTKEEIEKINQYTEFILNCGSGNNFECDDFDEFTRKVMNDTLTFDQMTFEVIRNRKGQIHSFIATDAATMRLADTFEQDRVKQETNGMVTHQLMDNYGNKQKIRGYLPTHCQVKDNVVTANYYPWEMCFGIRNPTTNIYSNGYGVSEIEILVNVITSMLWGDEYNRRFFSQGSAPKGFIKIKSGSNMNPNRLGEFKQQWQAMMAGVYNSWKTPVLEGDIDWVDLQKNNRDMEFAKWQEYLIKLVCAVFRIDPAEINFPLGGESDKKAMFEGNNEARLKHSKDKGLYPLLKFYQRKLNKYIMQQIDPEYELVFCGMDGINISDELDQDIKAMNNFMTIDEARIRRGMKPLGEKGGGNIIANAVWMQNYTAEQQQKMQAEQQKQQMQAQPQPAGGGDDDEYAMADQGKDEDPFQKAWDTFEASLN